MNAKVWLSSRTCIATLLPLNSHFVNYFVGMDFTNSGSRLIVIGTVFSAPMLLLYFSASSAFAIDRAKLIQDISNSRLVSKFSLPSSPCQSLDLIASPMISLTFLPTLCSYSRRSSLGTSSAGNSISDVRFGRHVGYSVIQQHSLNRIQHPPPLQGTVCRQLLAIGCRCRDSLFWCSRLSGCNVHFGWQCRRHTGNWGPTPSRTVGS